MYLYTYAATARFVATGGRVKFFLAEAKDVHHPLCKIRRSPPQTFNTPSVKSDVHHPRRSPPPILKCDIHHRPTFTTPYNHHPQKKNSPTVQAFKMFLQSKQPCTRAVEGSPSSG